MPTSTVMRPFWSAPILKVVSTALMAKYPPLLARTTSILTRMFFASPERNQSRHVSRLSSASTPLPVTPPERAETTRVVQVGSSGESQSGTLKSFVSAVRLSPLVSRAQGAVKTSGPAPLPSWIRTFDPRAVVGCAISGSC
jgi:hypothetical protein